jgi:hypothetical protein
MKFLFGIIASIFMFATPAQAITVNFDDVDVWTTRQTFELSSGLNNFSGSIGGGYDASSPTGGFGKWGYGFNFIIPKGFQLIDVILGTKYTSIGWWQNVDVDLFKFSDPVPTFGSLIGSPYIHVGGASLNGSLYLDPYFYGEGMYQFWVSYHDVEDGDVTANVSAVIHVSPIPLPASVWLLLTAFVGLFGYRSIGRLRVGHTA